jgi:hypothetical protein
MPDHIHATFFAGGPMDGRREVLGGDAYEVARSARSLSGQQDRGFYRRNQHDVMVWQGWESERRGPTFGAGHSAAYDGHWVTAEWEDGYKVRVMVADEEIWCAPSPAAVVERVLARMLQCLQLETAKNALRRQQLREGTWELSEAIEPMVRRLRR